MQEPEQPSHPKMQLKYKEYQRVNEPKGQETEPPVDVYAMLGENLTKHKAAEKPLDLTKRPSKRKRDYIWAMLLGNGFFGGALGIFWGNPVVMLYAIGGICIWTGGITWLMWFIMDDYD